MATAHKSTLRAYSTRILTETTEKSEAFSHKCYSITSINIYPFYYYLFYFHTIETNQNLH